MRFSLYFCSTCVILGCFSDYDCGSVWQRQTIKWLNSIAWSLVACQNGNSPFFTFILQLRDKASLLALFTRQLPIEALFFAPIGEGPLLLTEPLLKKVVHRQH